MKNSIWFILLVCWLPLELYAQVTGKWYVMGDDGITRSIVEISVENGKYQGKVAELLPTSKRTHCENCTGSLKGKQLTGMTILYDLTIIPNGGKDGKVLDPSTGKVFSCSIELVGPDKLKLRGYLGVPTVGKTAYWYRLKG